MHILSISLIILIQCILFITFKWIFIDALCSAGKCRIARKRHNLRKLIIRTWIRYNFLLYFLLPYLHMQKFKFPFVSFFIFYGFVDKVDTWCYGFPRICKVILMYSWIVKHWKEINMYRESGPFSSWNTQSYIIFIHKNTPNGYR